MHDGQDRRDGRSGDGGQAPLLEASAPFAPFDYFRVPYRVRPDASLPAGWCRLRVVREGSGPGPDGPALWWPSAPTGRGPTAARRGARAGVFALGSATVAGHVLTRDPVEVLTAGGSGWHAAERLVDDGGAPVAAVWRDAAGSACLPFDPGEVMHCLWSEAYTALGARARVLRAARGVALRGYYAVRPVLPRPVQLRMRRTLARRQQGHEGFPAWPIEDGLHELYAWLFDLVASMTGGPVPSIACWPDGFSWAMVLTHDVETGRGAEDRELLRADERRLGYRSSWNFVPERYDVTDELRDWVAVEGCEVGVHGLRHDGHDLASRRKLLRRLPAIRAYADRWGAVGFRSPATQRAWSLMPLLGFDHDSSYTDTDPYEPQPGGCATYLPFFVEDLVELPITLPQDHTLFEILRQQDGATWREKAEALRERGGLALALAHPDYAGNPVMARAWRELLEAFADDPTRWQPLPREAAGWWRARAASRLERDGDGWTVVGPAADRARVRMLGRPEPVVEPAPVTRAG